jgi:hypothetical protein
MKQDVKIGLVPGAAHHADEVVTLQALDGTYGLVAADTRQAGQRVWPPALASRARATQTAMPGLPTVVTTLFSTPNSRGLAALGAGDNFDDQVGHGCHQSLGVTSHCQ